MFQSHFLSTPSPYGEDSSSVFHLGLKAVASSWSVHDPLDTIQLGLEEAGSWPMVNSFLITCPTPLVCPQSLLMKIDAFHYVQLGTAYRSAYPDPTVA